MEFVAMRDKLIEHFNEMTKDVNQLFEVGVDKDELWNLYLDSFPPGTNEIYRERREHDCSCCRHFVKSIGNAVVIQDGKVHTIWEFDSKSTTYQPVFDALDRYVKAHAVSDVFKSPENKVGTSHNFENTVEGVKQWDHFYLELPNKFVEKHSIGTTKGRFRDTRNVFKRSLDEISLEAIETIMELISSNTLYKGAEWKEPLQEFRKYKNAYEKLDTDQKELFAWEQSVKAGPVIGKIKNHSIGVLLTDVSEGMDLDAAVRRYENIVAPQNYKRSKPIYTKRMLDDAKKTITELGYMESLKRRFATLDDITVNNILFSNKDSAKRIAGAEDIFADMERGVKSSPKKFSKVEEISADKFISEVLPTAQELEVYLENKHTSNMVSLIAPENGDSKTMFKWNNGFSWAYAGNVTDSMKERVKAAGGKVDGDLRFSIQWNESGKDGSDVDAHCVEPNGNEIYFGRKISRYTRGNLDVDIRYPDSQIAVENITWPDRRIMKEGVYKLYVHQFAARGVNDGFRAEIEFDGQIRSFEYNNPMRTGEDVLVAEVTLKDGVFTIKELLPSSISSKEVWNVHTNEFVPVSVVCYSPNYWDEQSGIGHKHVFFMLKDCVNPEMPNGFFNEYLKQELTEHRKVFEALGAKMHVKDVEDQLSGVGFSTTKRGEIVVKVKGNTERVMKVKF